LEESRATTLNLRASGRRPRRGRRGKARGTWRRGSEDDDGNMARHHIRVGSSERRHRREVRAPRGGAAPAAACAALACLPIRAARERREREKSLAAQPRPRARGTWCRGRRAVAGAWRRKPRHGMPGAGVAGPRDRVPGGPHSRSAAAAHARGRVPVSWVQLASGRRERAAPWRCGVRSKPRSGPPRQYVLSSPSRVPARVSPGRWP